MIEAAFLSNGLKKGESAVYLTAFEDPPRVSKSLEEAGLDDMDRFLNDGRLRIFKINSPADGSEGISHLFDTLFEKVFSGINPPIRVVGRLYNLISEGQVTRNIQIEEMTQRNMGLNIGSVMCSYDMSKISEQIQISWFLPVLKEHHALVTAPGGHKGIGFYMRD
jgi:hypothetical protein